MAAASIRPSRPINTFPEPNQFLPASVPVNKAPQTHVTPNIPKSLPFTSSNIDDFIKKPNREQKISSSSNEQDDFEPYSRRDFKVDVKSDKDSSSGYFTSPNEQDLHNKHLPSRVLSPDSSDYEKFEYKSEVKQRELHSSSPADSAKSTSSHRKSVSFDLDADENRSQKDQKIINLHNDEEDVFLDENLYLRQQILPERKLIKGILRSPSPGVYYQAATFHKGQLEKRYVYDDDEYDEEDEIEQENPFRKEYLSQEELNKEDEPEKTIQESPVDRFSSIRRSFENLSSTSSKIPIKKSVVTSPASSVPIKVDRPKQIPPRPPPPTLKPHVLVADLVHNEGLDKMHEEMEEGEFVEYLHDATTNTIREIRNSGANFTPDDDLPPLPKNPPPMFKRLTSAERPKTSPPPPPPPKISAQDVEIVPATYTVLQVQQKPRFVHENSTDNILVAEDVHRNILLQENEIRRQILTEYDTHSVDYENMRTNFSPTNPFVDHNSSFSSSLMSTPTVMSPVTTFERPQVVREPPQVLPVHYTQLPTPQQTGYFHPNPNPFQFQPNALYQNVQSGSQQSLSYQQSFVDQNSNFPQNYNPNFQQTPNFAPNPNFHLNPQFQGFQPYPNYQHFGPAQQQFRQPVSGDGQNIIISHNSSNNVHEMSQSAYGPSPQQNSMQQQHFVSFAPNNLNNPSNSHNSNVTGNNLNSRQPQMAYAGAEQQQLEAQLSPIRVNQDKGHFVFDPNEQQHSMASFGKQTSV